MTASWPHHLPLALRHAANDADALAHLVALSELKGMGPARLTALLHGRSTGEAWQVVRAGRVPAELQAAGIGARIGLEWAGLAAKVDPLACLDRYRELEIDVVVLGDPRYPRRLLHDPEPPFLLFSRGNFDALDAPTVAIVGTRRSTPYGDRVAHLLGRRLGECGIAVVSGLASGIDAAAHAGALEAGVGPPVGVVGTGPDVVYPRANTKLWSEVAGTGLLLGEAPLGARPDRWRFPARNRIVAGLAQVVVVVESHAKGGSLQTAEEAGYRDRTVMAVPGSVFSPASAGTNRLIATGIAPAINAEDVLVALGMGGARARERARHLEPGPRPVPDGSVPVLRPVDGGLPPDHDQRCVLAALGWEPARYDELALRSGMDLVRLAVAIDALEATRYVERHRGVVSRILRHDGPQSRIHLE